MKREDYISWDEYFMGIAQLSALRSKDPSTQVGACIVDKNKRILSIGYNGTPNGIDDKDFPWGRDGDKLETKYLYVCHSELNAIANCKGKDLSDATIYVTLFPCNECTKLIIQTGIKRVVYGSDKYADLDEFKASRSMLDQTGVICEEYKKANRKIEIEL